MAFVFNDFVKYNSTHGLTGRLRTILANSRIYFHSSSSAYSLANILSGAGSLGSITTNLPAYSSDVNNNIIFAAGTLQFTPSSTGTLAWVGFYSSSGPARNFITDSISSIGGSGIIQVSTTSFVSGTPVTVAFSLSII